MILVLEYSFRECRTFSYQCSPVDHRLSPMETKLTAQKCLELRPLVVCGELPVQMPSYSQKNEEARKLFERVNKKLE